MGILFADGFDQYGVTADLSRNWSPTLGNWTWNSTAGRTGGGAITSSGAGAFSFTTTCILSILSLLREGYSINGITAVTPQGSMGHGFWSKFSAIPSSNMVFIGWTNVSTPPTGGLYYLVVNTSTGFVSLNDASGARGTGNLNVCDNNWHWFEWYQATGLSNGKLYIDGILQASSATNNNNYPGYFFISQSNGCTVTVDDIIIFDGWGGSPRTDEIPMGPRIISTLKPDSDSSVTFTPDTGGTNYTQVNETAADDDTHYVQTSSDLNTDLYTYGNLPFTPAVVSAIQTVSRVKNPGSSPIRGRSKISSGGTAAWGNNIAMPLSYLNIRDSRSYDPNTGAAWTPSAINALLAGVECETNPTYGTWNPTDSANASFTWGTLIGVPNTIAASINGIPQNCNGVRGTISYAQGGAQKLYLELYTGAIGGGSNATTVGLGREDAAITGASVNSTNVVAVNASSQLVNNAVATNSYMPAPITCVFGIALDVSARRVWFRPQFQNLPISPWYGSTAGGGSADPASNTGGIDISGWFTSGHSIYPITQINVNQCWVGINCGHFPFLHPIPSGFSPWDLLTT